MLEEKFVPGRYTVTNHDGILLRASMSTLQMTNIKGKYSLGNNFTVYQVYPEVGGILWGRVTSSVETGTALYVALRVENKPKVKMEQALEDDDGVMLALKLNADGTVNGTWKR